MNLSIISDLIKRHETELRQQGVKSLAVFGSVAHGNSTPSSDIDLLVEFDRPVGLFDFIRLKKFLEDLTHSSVDLVTPDALRTTMRATILNEAVYVYRVELEDVSGRCPEK